MSYIILRRHWFHIIVLMFMPQQRIKLMMWKIASMTNWNVYSINSLNTTWKFCWKM
jgi:hypothetical protein